MSIDDPGELAALQAAGRVVAETLRELVITVEPIIAAGAGDVHGTAGGWTVKTDDGSRSAHAEHTIVVTDGTPLLVTA